MNIRKTNKHPHNKHTKHTHKIIFKKENKSSTTVIMMMSGNDLQKLLYLIEKIIYSAMVVAMYY